MQRAGCDRESWTDTQRHDVLTLHGYCRTEGEEKLKEFIREKEKRKTILIKASDKSPIKTHEQNKKELVSSLPTSSHSLLPRCGYCATRSLPQHTAQRGLPCTMLSYKTNAGNMQSPRNNPAAVQDQQNEGSSKRKEEEDIWF